MKKQHSVLFAIFFALLLLVILFPAQAMSEKTNGADGKYVPGEIIVKMKAPAKSQSGKFGIKSFDKKYDSLNVESAKAMVNIGVDVKNVEKLPLDNTYIMKFSSEEEMNSILQSLENNPDVEYAQPNYIYHILSTPNDPYYPSYQWGLAKINISTAWDIGTGNNSVIIAVVDSGIEYNHTDLAANIWNNTGEIWGNGADDDGNGFTDDVYGWNFNGTNNNTMDNNGHGTHVAGIAGAVSNNSIGIAGVCWNCKLMPVKVTDGAGITTSSQLASGINYSANMNASIISISIGGTSDDTVVRNSIDYAYSRGSVIVAASGNDGDNGNPIMYPAAYENVIAVAATNNTDGRASYSEYGSWVDISAPGGDNLTAVTNYSIWILSTYVGNDYAIGEGTSMAAPFVSGVVGLMLSVNPLLKHSDIVAILNSTADPLNDTGMGAGIINAYRALGEAANYSNVSSCRNFTIANRSYSLTSNISSEGTCIEILADNITIDCSNYTISYANGSMGYGVNISGFNSTKIMNCNIIQSGNYSNSHGIYLSQNSGNSNMTSIRIYTNGTGSYGIIFNGSSSNNISYSIIENRNGSAIYLMNYSSFATENNTIYNCLLNGSIVPVNFSIDFPANAVNYWNSSMQSGTRIYTNGLVIGGNYYTNSTGDGYSDLCDDVNETGFCDQLYDVASNTNCTASCSNNTDYLAMSKRYNFQTIVENVSILCLDSMNRTNCTLVASYDVYDPDNQTFFNETKWFWLRNGTWNSSFDGNYTVTAENTTKGDVWIFSINISDGISWHTCNWFNSSNITIQNAAPDLSLILPASGNEYNHTIAFSWNGSDIDGDNVTYNFSINGTLDNSSSYANSSNMNDNFTSLVLFPGYYNWSILASDNTSETEKNGSFYVNGTTPSITHFLAPPIVINGTNVTLAVNISNTIADAIWVNITLPDSSSERIDIANNTPVNYSNTSMNGTYIVTFFANNTFGNMSNATATFNSSAPITMNVNVTNTSGTGISNNVTIYYNNYVIASNTTQGGNINQQVPNSTYTVYVKTYGNNFSLIFWSVDFTNSSTMILGIDKPSISGYNLTYAVNYSMASGSASLVINYTGTPLANENYLGLYKCDLWNFSSENCSGTWTNITGTASVDTNLNTMSFVVTGFSAFAIKQEAYCGDTVCNNGETSSTCSADCGVSGSPGSSSSGGDYVSTTTTMEETVTTTIEDISWETTTTFEEYQSAEVFEGESNETVSSNQEPLVIDWLPFYILIAIGAILAIAYFLTNKMGVSSSMETLLLNKTRCYKDLVALERQILELKKYGYDTTKIDNEAILAKRSIDSEAFGSARVHIENAKSLLGVYRKEKK